MAHITGGGLRENVARALPADADALIDRRSWQPPPVFAALKRLGVSGREMKRVFNMGIGFVLFVRPRFARGVMRVLRRAAEKPVLMGQIVGGSGRVRFR